MASGHARFCQGPPQQQTDNVQRGCTFVVTVWLGRLMLMYLMLMMLKFARTLQDHRQQRSCTFVVTVQLGRRGRP